MKNNDFIKKILPGNYNLTKSMEISRTETSGTLWYTKKFLVLYNIIFLNENLDTTEYFKKINTIFSEYIVSLNPKVQKDATEYFFNGHKEFDSSKIKSFNQFIEHVNYKTRKEAVRSKRVGKEYYFAYLMGTGGQSGVKKIIKDYLYSEDFKLSISKIEEIVQEYNTKNEKKRDINEMVNDYAASLRNERQVLYYYGFFHSKNAGASDLEFSSLTPVGELAYAANSIEFQVLWEHQKLKMISQPMNVTIKGVSNAGVDLNYTDFSINYSPYYDILRYLHKFKSLTPNEYKYLLSRNKESQNLFDEDISYLRQNIDYIIKRIESFNRPSDINSDDSQKELKKYLLGITDHITKDKKTNLLGVIESFNNIKIVDDKKFDIIYKSYSEIENYKRKKYLNLFNSVNKDMNKYYVSQSKKDSYEKDQVIKTNWNLYNGKIEDSILINVVFLYIVLTLDKSEKTINFSEFKSNYKELFPNISSYFSLTIPELKELFNMKENDEMMIIEEEVLGEEDFSDIDSTYFETSVLDLKNKILQLSEDTTYDFIINKTRKRSKPLISAIKNYYLKAYDHDFHLTNQSAIKCECCRTTTFITENIKPYMELHHIIPFGGETKGQDHYLNLINLCPTCHTKLHRINREEKSILYKKMDENNYLEKTIKDRLFKLKSEKLLKSYQLEYLLAERAITEEEYSKIGAYNEE